MIGADDLTRAEILEKCAEGRAAWDAQFWDNVLHYTRGYMLQEFNELRQTVPGADLEEFSRQYIAYRAKVRKEGPRRADPALIPAEGVQEEGVSWLWFPYIPKGKLTIIAGPAGTGKTFLTARIAAAISTGALFPGEEETARKPGNVLLINAEDGAGDTIKPRLRMAGADLHKVFLAVMPLESKPLTFDSPLVEKFVQQTRPAAVIFDPFQAFLGSRVDVNRSNETRPMLAHLVRIAEKYSCAVIIVMHLSKMTNASFMARVLGSVDIAAAARSVIGICPHPKIDGEKVFSHEKSNLAQAGCSYVYSIQGGAVCFGDPTDLKADDCLQARKKRTAAKIAEARALIERILAEHPGEWVDAQRLYKAAAEIDISERTVRDAIQALPIRRRKDGFAGPVQWQLMPEEEEDF